MQCELCGRETDLFIAEVEGTELRICEKCAKFGKIIRRVPAPAKIKAKSKSGSEKGNPPGNAEETEVIELIAEGYGMAIRNKRERMGLSQKDFAKRVAEKESLIQKLETENIEPSIPLAKKLEKILGVKLVEEVRDTKVQAQKGRSAIFTLGDFVKIRKRK